MQPIGSHNYFVYIITNYAKTVLYTGMTNDLDRRLQEHAAGRKNGRRAGFTAKYQCKYLLYWERYQYVQHAIEREKELKGWTRLKKERLIASMNPHWFFLNDEVCG